MKRAFWVILLISFLILLSSPLLANSSAGEKVYNKRCSICHGIAGAGTDMGPPLVHKIYEPGHHGDGSFYMAVARGVTSHHWSFGNMPPIQGVTKEEVGYIIKYIRALQRKAGIN